LAKLIGVAGSMIGVLLLARRAYYGEWYPNTYFLKVTGWPLDNRLSHGWLQNSLTVLMLAELLPLAVFGWLRLDRQDRPLLLALTAAPLCVAYSTFNGGDFLWPSFGYDRFASPSTALLVLGLAALVMKARVRRWEFPLLAAAALSTVAIPASFGFTVVRGVGFAYRFSPMAVRRLFDPRSSSAPDRELMAGELIYRGKLIGEIIAPPGRIAVCDAGALIYFSKRGGVDVLGKVEPYIAHMPALLEPPPNRRCWRNFAPSGHNKEDLLGLFRLRRPELSQVAPPAELTSEYVPITYNGREFYARRGSPLIEWDVVTLPVATVPNSR
jgi:hypothetical protein